jgi:hypothetical protein
MRYYLLTSRSTKIIRYFLLQKMTDIQENILLYSKTIRIKFVAAYKSQYKKHVNMTLFSKINMVS